MRLFTILSLLLPLAAQADLFVNISSYAHPHCFDSDGQVHVYAVGGIEPYTYAWADGPVGQDRTGLPAGTYTVTVTDNVGATAERTIDLVDGFMQHPGGTYAGLFACPGQSNGLFALANSAATGQPPYSTVVYVNGVLSPQVGTNPQGDPMYGGIATGDDVSYEVTDVNGCIAQGQFMVYGPLGTPALITDITPACGPSLGSVLFDATMVDWPVDVYVTRDTDGAVVMNEAALTTMAPLTGLEPGNYTVMQHWSWSMLNSCDPVISEFIIEDLGDDCGTVNGTSWYDVDEDCTQDPAEVPIPFSTLLVQPGDQYVLTDGQGRYSYRLVNGAYTLEQTDPTLVPICPATQPVPFNVATNEQTIDLANGSTEPLDMALYIAQGAARPGMVHSQWGTLRNLSPQLSGPITLTCEFDPAVDFLSATPVPASVVGNLITWVFPAFGSFQDEDIFAQFTVPASVPLGTQLAYAWTIGDVVGDLNSINNSLVLWSTVTGSFDPNDKRVRTSTGISDSEYYIQAGDQWLDYTIRFQNTGTDTAFTVVITDTLSPLLDMASFEQGTTSHPFVVAFKPGRVVEWRFDDILLPDSTTDEAASHGLVNFRIRPVQPALPGSVMENEADIFFDFNEPVRTNTAIVTVELSTLVQEQRAAEIALVPNPASDHVRVITGSGAVERVYILAMDGRIVRIRTERGTAVDIGLAQLASGSYIVLVELNDGTTVRSPLIKH